MKNYLPFYVITLLFISCKDNKSDTSESADGNAGNPSYQLVWQDEFDYSGKPDPAKWKHEQGYIRNNEAQYYTDSLNNARVENGFLILEARKEKVANEAFTSEDAKKWQQRREFSAYTSASLKTEGLVEWKYGKFEVSAKLPEGRGMWPAIWMLGENIPEVGWPKCGEIDIMEHVGFNKDSIFGTVHTEAFNHIKGTEVGKSIFIENPYEEFHVYAVEWTPEKIVFFLDGEAYHEFANRNMTVAEWPFDQKFNLKLNVAVGGAWGGQQGIDDSIFPQRMVVDFVRVYQLQ